MEILLERGNERFVLDKVFDIKYLDPIGQYVRFKSDSGNGDDYNELYHATRLIEQLKQDPALWFDTHVLYRGDVITGVLFIVGGNILKLEHKFKIEQEDQSLLLKYFHIVDKGRGLGTFWINSVVLPYYRNKGFKYIHINSSHPDSFPFYERIGSLNATYVQVSDNNQFKRVGKSFLINL